MSAWHGRAALMFYLFSTVTLILIGLGIWQRRNRRLHMALNLSAFFIDLSLVLAIEIRRHAIEHIMARQVSSLTLFHAGISLTMLILYGLMAYLGFQIAKGSPWARQYHRYGAFLFASFKLTNYITSFFVGKA